MIPVQQQSRGKLQIEATQKALNIWDMVDLCTDCASYCKEKTKKFVTEAGFQDAPGGFISNAMNGEAIKRQAREMERCELACLEVKRICPTSKALRDKFENKEDEKPDVTGKIYGPHGSKAMRSEVDGEMAKQLEVIELQKTKDGKQYADKTAANRWARGLLWSKNPHVNVEEVVWQERPYENAEDTEGLRAVQNRKDKEDRIAQATMFRCETAATEFSKVLFTIANKPTTIQFEKMSRPGTTTAVDAGRDVLMKDALTKESAAESGTGNIKEDPEALAKLYESHPGLAPMSEEQIQRGNAWRNSIDEGLRFDDELAAKQKEAGTYVEKPRATVPDFGKHKY